MFGDNIVIFNSNFSVLMPRTSIPFNKKLVVKCDLLLIAKGIMKVCVKEGHDIMRGFSS